MKKLIAVDLGTTLIKCTLFDESGKVLCLERLPCHLQHPHPGWAQQDANLWYTGVCDLIRSFVQAYGPEEIAGICISSQGISLVPVDAQFQPLMDAISWLDIRAEEETAALAEKMPVDQWFTRTGKFLSPGYTLPKILWLRKHRPELTEKTHQYLLPLDYLNARMTSNAVTDHTMAAGTMCYRVSSGTWDPEILALAGLQEKQLSTIRPSGEAVGPINEETAQRTGLSPQTLVFNGGQDQKVAAFAAGIQPHCSSLSLGTAGALEILVEDAASQNLLPFFPYVIPGQTLVEGCINTTGAAIQWMKDTLFPEASFDEMNALAAASPPGSHNVRFYPHLNKPGTPHRGLDQFGSIQGLSLGIGRGDIIRSLYEGLAYEFRLNLEQAAQAGSHTKELLLFGGASKSNIFCQIIADVTGLGLRVFENGELCSIGAAKLAAQGLGLDAERLTQTAAGCVQVYSPQPETAKQYEALYAQYVKEYFR